MRWGWLLTVSMLGCASRASTNTVSADSATTETAADAALDAAPYDWDAAVAVPVGEPLRCGPGPWMPHRWQWGRAFGKKDPVVGSKYGIDLCPNMWVRSGDDGSVMMYVPEGARYSVLIEPAFDIGLGDKEAHGEMLATWPRADSWYALEPPPSPWSKRVDVTQGAIHLMPYVTPDGSIAPCDDFDGTSFEVVDHPEAKVHYFAGYEEVVGATAVPPGGSIWVNGLAPGSRVALRGHKEGCLIRPGGINAEKPQTLRVFAGYFSYYAFEVAPLPKSDGGTD
ncbi:MAG: hypothetical protein ACXWUG_24465 [Polyangiales bacterium]